MRKMVCSVSHLGILCILILQVGRQCRGFFCEIMETSYGEFDKHPADFEPFSGSISSPNAYDENSIEALSLENSVSYIWNLILIEPAKHFMGAQTNAITQ